MSDYDGDAPVACAYRFLNAPLRTLDAIKGIYYVRTCVAIKPQLGATTNGDLRSGEGHKLPKCRFR
jgi:hypothetical protein